MQTALIVLPNDILGGAEKKLKIIALELTHQNLEVHVQFLKKRISGGWDDISNKVNLHFTNYSRERTAMLAFPKMILKHNKNNILYTFSSNTGINGSLGILRRLKILKTTYLIVRESTQLLDRFGGIRAIIYRSLYYLGYPATDLVICQTQHMLDRLKVHVPQARKWNNKIIPNPIKTEDVIIKSTVEIDLNKFGKYILGVGRLMHLKGFDLLIKAMKQINPEYNLVMVGSGPEEENLKSIVVDWGLNSRVFFAGYQHNPYPFMDKAQVCVIPSRVEGFPNTLLQMMTLNERVVSTLCAGDIDQLKGVITCPTNNYSKLAEAINRAIGLTINEKIIIRNHFDKELTKRTPEKFLQSIFENL